MQRDSGEILINGYSIDKQYEKAMACVGGIVENPETYQYMTGIQNLRQYARMRTGVTEDRIREVVRIVGLENRINDKVKKYSLGMKQRLGVAQSIMHHPDLLILDEPTNGLDLPESKNCATSSSGWHTRKMPASWSRATSCPRCS